MAVRFTIPAKGYSGLETLIELGNDRLVAIFAALTGKPLRLDLGGLARELAEAVGYTTPERLADAIRSVVFPLNNIRMGAKVPAEELVGLLPEQLRRQKPDWYEKHSAGVEAIKSSLVELIRPDGYFQNLYKAILLVVNHPTVARGFRILTELRPVYNDDATRVLAMLLTGTLVVEYEEQDVPKIIHFAIDRQDLSTLRDQLERALKKIELLEQQAGKLEVPILVAGEES
jgi:hypothetical protein